MDLFSLFKRKPKPFSWEESESGNRTWTGYGSRVTVFQDRARWKICVASTLPDDEDNDGDPDYSEPFKTEAEAVETAEAMIRNMLSKR